MGELPQNQGREQLLMLSIALRSLQIGILYADRLSTVARPARGFWHERRGHCGG